jgi:hypothetical protein
MSIWFWVLLGIIGFFAVSFLVGLLIAAILANIGRAFSELVEFEPVEWSELTDPAESTSDTTERRLVGGRSTSGRLK